MSNRPGRLGTAGSNKLMNMARRMNAPPSSVTKRPILLPTSGPPPPKKPQLSSSNTSLSGKKTEEQSKEKKPLFELASDWKDLAGSDVVTSTDFDEKVDISRPETVEKAILMTIRSLTDACRGDLELIQKLSRFIVENFDRCKSPYIIQGLFEVYTFIESKEHLPLISQALSAIFADVKFVTPFMFKLILNDSCGKRFWVDYPGAAPTYYSVMSAFSKFVVPPEELYEKAELVSLKRGTVDVSVLEKKVNLLDNSAFTSLVPDTEEMILQKCLDEPTKGLVRTAAFLVNNVHFRKIILKKLETWLQAIALQRCAPEIILFICVNVVDFGDDSNVETIKELFMLFSLQKKQHQIMFLACLERWLATDKKSIDVFVTIILDHEFSPRQRMPHLYMLMQYLYLKNVDETSKLIANRIVSVLITPKGVKAVRNFFKEFTKAGFKVDFQFGLLCRYIFEAVKSRINQRELFNDDFNTGDLIKNTVQLCSIMPVLAISPAVKDAGNARRSGTLLTSFQSGSMNRFQIQIQLFWVSSAEFLRWAASAGTKLAENSFLDFYDILFFINLHTKGFTFNDGWPTEAELVVGVKAIQESTVDESVISALLAPSEFTDVSKGGVAITPTNLVDILERLTQRLLAARPLDSEQSLLVIKSVKILDQLFDLPRVSNFVQFASAEDDVPIGIKSVYIKCWRLAMNWTLMSRKTFLKPAYEKFAMMRMALHMLMTRSDFPILRFEGKSQADLIADDTNEMKKEYDAVKSFFTKLKEKSIPFASISRPDELCLLYPRGCPRSFVVDYQLCKSKEIGPVLCGIRDPDLLKRLSNDDMADYARPAVHEAIAKNPSLIQEMPILTIANLFLEDTQSPDNDQVLSAVKTRLIETLQRSGDEEREIVHFLVSRLCADLSEDRRTALNAVQCLIGDESTADKRVEALSNLPSFDVYCDYICRELSHAITIESDMERIYNFIGFITNHGNKDSDIAHVVALRLTSIIERVGSNKDSTAHQQVQDSLADFFANYLKSASEGSQPPFEASEEDFGLQFRVKLPSFEQEFIISSKILGGMMNLLCEASAVSNSKANPNREYLLNALFGNGTEKLNVVAVADGTKVDVLPEDLRRRMLSSYDGRIVKAALNGMTVEKALQFLQSFAINAVAYSQLLALVNAVDIPQEEAKKAAVFVRAYRLRGAQGADEFLAKIEGRQEARMDVDDDSILANLDPKPTIELAKRRKISASARKFDTAADALAYFNEVVDSDVSSMKLVTADDWILFSKTLMDDERIAREIAAFIGEITNENIHIAVRLTVLSLISQVKIKPGFNEIVAGLANTAIGRMSDFKLIISRLTTDKGMVRAKKEITDVSAILNELSRERQDGHHDNNLLHLFHKLRPEVIDPSASESTLCEQITAIFKVKSSAIMKVIELLAATTLPSTVRRVVNFLLKSFELSISPGLVIEFVEKCVKSPEESRRVVPTAEQSIVLIDYVIANMTFESQSNSVVPQFLVILEALMETHGNDAFEKVLHAISDKLEEALMPPMDEPHYLILNKLLEALGKRFCGCRETVEGFQENGGTIWKQSMPKRIFSVHRQVCFGICEFKEATYAGDIARIKIAHEQLLAQPPQVIGAHLQLLTNRVAPVLTMIKKEYKEPHFIKFLEHCLEIVLKASPHSMNDPRALDQFLKVYITFFYNRITTSHRFMHTFYLLVDVCLEYTLKNPDSAQKFLKTDEELFVSMMDHYKDYTPLVALTRQLKNY